MMTGWRVGAIIAQPELVRAMLKINSSLIYTTPSVSQRAALAALGQRRRIRISTSRPTATGYSTPPIGWRRSSISVSSARAAPSISSPAWKKTGLTDAEFCKRLLDEAHILVMPGSGLQGRCGALPHCCTVDIDKLRLAYDRMEKLSF